jgi:GNAT superfamily N-acetyltransferase
VSDSTAEAVLSEFYSLRRTSIKDTTGLLGFVFGWFASAPIAWPYIKAGFDTGDPTKGVFRFILVVFGAGILCGALGLGLGAIGGMVWERMHRRRRLAHPQSSDAVAAADGTPAASNTARRRALPALRYGTEGVTADDYLALMRGVAPDQFDVKRAAAALEQSITIGAWDGARLVGVARILSDGYFFAALADIIVDPDLQRCGVGRELMNRAYAKTPRGSLFIGAPLGTGVFFDHLGCERGPSGFTMHRASKPASSGVQVPA